MRGRPTVEREELKRSINRLEQKIIFIHISAQINKVEHLIQNMK